MDACLSFTTVSIFTDTDTYTDHGHGSQFTDLWMASLTVTLNTEYMIICDLLFLLHLLLSNIYSAPFFIDDSTILQTILQP